jgi:uncharacterized protein YbbC (DUF1343 family)
VRSVQMGLEIAAVLLKKYPDHFDVSKTITLLGNQATVDALKAGTPVEQIVASWGPELAAFEQVRRKYWLYK